ncbi:hypothetical protein EYC84_001853 [Monilinia fructicola]|uniref:Uncharacterized protein n=1 Tax=Monilinia fructicola TaxID=38448 RepID=A0A5M9JVT7_MONFR|nr:hypothetical protein EYC84_001853 [Monilinia fructicola]
MANLEAQDILKTLSTLVSDSSFGSNPKIKQEAVRLSKALTATLEEPENVAMELAFSTFVPMSARIAVDLNLFEHIANHDGPITVAQLSSLSGAETLLISRILRLLSEAKFVKEVGEETWEATPITVAMTLKGIAAGHRMLFNTSMAAAIKAPQYFREAGYKCPTSPHDGLMQYAHHTKLQSFDYFCTMPNNVIGDFNTFMGSTMGARKYWLDWFPVTERVLGGAKADAPLIVDVGGGKGHDIEAFNKKFPGRGKLVLQDQQHVLDEIEELDPTIERVGYNFFTPQPIKNARVYFYHHILHDWSDYKCLEILQNLKEAMKPGYSKLLIHDMILPEQGASTYHALLDLTMMAFNSGMERTGKQWVDLLERAGFEVVKLSMPEDEPDADGIVEAVLKE